MNALQNNEKKQASNFFGRWKILIPIILGISIASFLLYSTITKVEFYKVKTGTGEYSWVDQNDNQIVDYSDVSEFKHNSKGDYSKRTFIEQWNQLHFTFHTLLFLFLAMVMMVIRDFGYMLRIRSLTDNELSWKQSFRVIMIWEFASAVTPSIVGGAPIAMFILKKEGINLGRSTAIVLVTTFLDELFYVLLVPIVLILIGTSSLFPEKLTTLFEGNSIQPTTLFFMGFGLIFILVLFLFVALFIAPYWFKKILLLFSRIFFLRKYRAKMEKTGDDIIIASNELKGKNFSFWSKAFGATVMSWMGRFLVINCIILAFSPYIDQLLLFARQLSMWVILLISPTPGGSGIAEFAFSGFLNDFIPFGMVAILAILWRIISYYPYLFIGAWIIPRWMNNKN